MTTVPDPLSAGLMMMSVLARSLVRASHSFAGRLSGLFLDLERFQVSFSTAFRYVSRAGSLFIGGFQVLFSLNLCCSGS